MAIFERGWFPYNKNLLTYSTLCTTMTDEDREKERENITIPKSILSLTIDVTNDSSPSYDPQYFLSGTKPNQPLNFPKACLYGSLILRSVKQTKTQRVR